MILSVLLISFCLFSACSNDSSDQDKNHHGEDIQVLTTLTRNYDPYWTYDGFNYRIGNGEPHKVFTEEAWVPAPGSGERFWSIFYIFHTTDEHLTDEEGPTRLSFMDVYSILNGMLAKGYFLAEDLSPHVLNAMVLTANRVMELFGRDFDMLLSTGDSSDNSSWIEIEWFRDIMDCPNGIVNPYTGGSPERVLGPQQPYNPYHRSGYPDSNFSFPCKGLKSRTGEPLTWFSLVGNHDVLNLGTFPIDMKGALLNNFFFSGEDYTGAFSPLGYLRGFPTLVQATLSGNPPPREFYNFFGGPIVGKLAANPVILEKLVILTAGSVEAVLDELNPNFSFNQLIPEPFDPKTDSIGIPIPPDPAREAVGMKGLVDLVSAKNGFNGNHDQCNVVFSGGQDLKQGYYIIDYISDLGIPFPLRIIALNTQEIPTLAQGSMSQTQYQWFKCELERAQQDNRLVIVTAHHPPERFFMIEGEPCIGKKCGDVFVDLLNQYPNVFLNLVGHTHFNKIVPRRADAKGKENGYWEIQTCSSSYYWPQQGRIIEFVVYESGIAEIWCTMLDHYPISESEDTNILTELSRKLALEDPKIPVYPGSNPPMPWGNGKPSDRNRVLRLKIPDSILYKIKEMTPSMVITSRDNFPGGHLVAQ